MIHLTNILNEIKVKKLSYLIVTEEGLKAIQHITHVYEAFRYFNADPDIAFDNNSTYWKATILDMFIDEGIIRRNLPSLESEVIQRYKEIIDDDEKAAKRHIEELIRAGYVKRS